MSMKPQWNGKLEDFPLERYPDYRPGLPPDWRALASKSFLDECAYIWGKRWGSMGIGKLREVALIKPTDLEGNPLWGKAPEFFLLRYKTKIDVDHLIRNHEEYAQLLESLDIKVHWMPITDRMGAYGPMRKLFMAQEALITPGGAILPRFGHGSFKRGLERELQRFLLSIDCPILFSVHGTGICEPGPMFVPVAEGVFVTANSCSANSEGNRQVSEVLMRVGAKEIHVMNLPTIHKTFEAGGEFHTDMVLTAVDDRKALIYPDNLDWATYEWLLDHGFELIEIPKSEHHAFVPANLIVVEPGVVIMPRKAVQTTSRLEAAGVKVINFDSSGIMQGGVNGPRCITMYLRRDPGPTL